MSGGIRIRSDREIIEYLASIIGKYEDTKGVRIWGVTETGEPKQVAVTSDGKLKISGTISAELLDSISTIGTIQSGNITATIPYAQPVQGSITASISAGVIDQVGSLSDGRISASITSGVVDRIGTIIEGKVTASISGGQLTASISEGRITASIVGGIIREVGSISSGMMQKIEEIGSISEGRLTASIQGGKLEYVATIDRIQSLGTIESAMMGYDYDAGTLRAVRVADDGRLVVRLDPTTTLLPALHDAYDIGSDTYSYRYGHFSRVVYAGTLDTNRVQTDQIAEKTAGAGITLLSVSKHQGGIQTDSISELTSGARVSLPSGLKTDTIEEYTSGARVSFPHGIKTDRIEEKTSGAGIDIGAGSLYVNQSLKLIRWKQKKYALYFNGNAYVNCGNPSSLQITGDLTIEVRIIPHKLNAFQGIVSKNYLYEYEVAIYSANNGLAYRHGDGTNQDSIQFNNFFEDVDVPVTITVVRDSANKVVSAYKNGEFFGQHSYTVDPAVGSYDLEIGRRSGDGYYFDGKIFYVRIYNRILTESEIKYNCNNPQSPVTDGLVLWLNFDGGYGDKAYDLSGYGNHGTAYNCEWVEEEIYAGSRFPGNRFGLLYAAEIRQLGAGGINLGDGTLYVDQANKRVGIGTTSPAVKLHVAGFARVDETFQINKGTVAGGLRHIELMSGGLLRIGIGLVGDETGDNAGADLAIWRYSDTGGYLGNVMKVIRSTGNVAFCDNRIVFEQADIIIRPYTDNVGSVGTDSYRWALVRAVTVTQGDIGFGPEDQPCPVCGKKFEVGDVVVLKVHKVLESGEFRARPIHLKCAG
mgnify:CR=1 FL=1